MKIKRICSGEYYATNGTRTVEISKFADLGPGPQWVACATWDRRFVTDPLWTYREAKEAARQMIES